MSVELQETENDMPEIDDWRIKFLVDHLLTGLPSPDWHDDTEITDEELYKSKVQLAEAYLGTIDPGLTGLVMIVLVMITLDTISNINPISYGLAVSIWASAVMLVPSLKSPGVIASLSSGNANVSRRLHSQEMAYNNFGFALLGIGFILQIMGLHTDSHLIETALLTDEMPRSIATGAILFAVLFPIYAPKSARQILPVLLTLGIGFVHIL